MQLSGLYFVDIPEYNARIARGEMPSGLRPIAVNTDRAIRDNAYYYAYLELSDGTPFTTHVIVDEVFPNGRIKVHLYEDTMVGGIRIRSTERTEVERRHIGRLV